MMSSIQIIPILFQSQPPITLLPTLQFNHTNQYFQTGGHERVSRVNHLALIPSQLSVHCVVHPKSVTLSFFSNPPPNTNHQTTHLGAETGQNTSASSGTVFPKPTNESSTAVLQHLPISFSRRRNQ